MKKSILLITALFFTAFLHCLHAQNYTNGMIAATPGSADKNGVYYYAGLDEKPDFPDRENSFEKQIIDKVSTEQYKDSWGSHLNIVLSFIIEKDGSVTHAEVVNNHATATNKKAIDTTVKEVIDAIKAIRTKWRPGKHKKKKVRTGMEINIRIPIHKSDAPYKERVINHVEIAEISPDSYTGVEPPQDNGENGVYAAAGLQVSPEFPGGIKALQTYVTDNINKEKLPVGTRGKDLKVYASFIVERDGSLTAIKILRDPGYGIGKETERVLKLLTTKWSPGIRNGKPVRSPFNLPIVIKMPE